MLVQFKKKRDGTNTLHCVRDDGTATGQRQDGVFFVLHDLGHYAIETTLGLRGGFYGILARGWDIGDFGTPWPRGPIPPDAVDDATLAEHLAGMLDGERANSLPPMEAAELNIVLAAQFEQAGRTLHRPLTDGELGQIRATVAQLSECWRALPPGETLTLPFP